MFKAMPMGSTIAVDRRFTTQLFRSANATQVGYGAGPMRMARAYVFAIEVPGGLARVYVFLGLVERAPTGEPLGLLFRAEQDEVARAYVPGLVQEALQLVHAQGFQMEDVQVAALDEARRALVLGDLPFEATSAFLAAPTGAAPPVAELVPAAMDGVTHDATPIDISQHISLPGRQTVQAIGRILSLF